MGNRVIIITGVSGSGKTTVGQALGKLLRISFYDGDAFHPASNIARMKAGIPLNDDDRLPFLSSINAFIKEKLPSYSLIIACSALKEEYRKILSEGLDAASVVWVHLQGDYDLIYQRMTERKGHFMNAGMLRSQYETYEKPGSGIIINIGQDMEQIIHQIMTKIEISKSDAGLIGLGVMGTSLARNIAGKGFSISVYNRHVAGKEEGVAKKAVETFPELEQAKPFDDLEAFVNSLARPRKIILMVNAGKAVNDVILTLVPLLEEGDVIVDGGNSHYKETEEHQKLLALHGIHFVGAGISGGEEGALLGPSIMPGGSKAGYLIVKDILLSIAARNGRGEICCDYIGDGGAGHFVKMVHNGIEYAEMQLIAEFYSHFRYDQRMGPEEIAAIFEDWDSGDAGSYLLGITKDILRFRDADGAFLVDRISDEAGNKGTGSWTTIAASELGVPMPAMAEALFSRYLSSFSADRTKYAGLYKNAGESVFIERDALLRTFMFCRMINHCQGINLIREASDNFGWQISTEALLRIWSGGCIIRSVLLDILRKHWLTSHEDILEHPYVLDLINVHLPEIKDTIAGFSSSARAYPVSVSCLEYFKGQVTSRSNAYIIQAQRDYFGAHTYKRTDDPSGTAHHTKWA